MSKASTLPSEGIVLDTNEKFLFKRYDEIIETLIETDRRDFGAFGADFDSFVWALVVVSYWLEDKSSYESQATYAAYYVFQRQLATAYPHKMTYTHWGKLNPQVDTENASRILGEALFHFIKIMNTTGKRYKVGEYREGVPQDVRQLAQIYFNRFLYVAKHPEVAPYFAAGLFDKRIALKAGADGVDVELVKSVTE